MHDCAFDKTKGACAPGTEFVIQVNKKDKYRFYVLEDAGNKVTLILDRNLGDNVAWYADEENNSYGPITALTYLQSQTSTWTNLPEMTISTFDYDDDREEEALGNNKVFKMYTRLPKYSEINTIMTNNGGTIPTWLYTNLYGTGDDSASGYWTSTANSSNSDFTHILNGKGDVGNDYVNNVSRYGVRPVIELSK